MTDMRDDAIAAYCAELIGLEDDLEQVQTDKKLFFENAREANGRKFVAALKLAVKTARMDPDKRTQAEEIDAEAERILRIMRKGPRVARGARTRESEAEAAGADPETGEFHDSDVTTESVAPVIASEDFIQVQPCAQPATVAEPATVGGVAAHPAASFAPVERHGGEKPVDLSSETANAGGENVTTSSAYELPVPEQEVRTRPVNSSEEPGRSHVSDALSKVVFFHEDADPLCARPEHCGSFSRMGLCERYGCRARSVNLADAQVSNRAPA